MSQSEANGRWSNQLLAAMPRATLALLQRDLSHVVLTQGAVCFDAGEPIQRVYFPTSSLISLVVSTGEGDQVETGMVGREGAVGLHSAAGPRYSFARAIVQVAGESYTISTELLRRATDSSEEAKNFIERYIEVRWAEAQQLAACNAVHTALPRLARWLLLCADRTGSMQMRLTQEFLGEMLGIRRTSVTLLAQDLQARGIIRYSRGRITILDRPKLQSYACECYRTIQHLYCGLNGSGTIAAESKAAGQLDSK
jgi:CRP-like cAMP-binding protein